MRRIIIRTIAVGLLVFTGVSNAEDTHAAVISCPNLTVDMYFGVRDSETGGQVTELQRFLATYYHLDQSEYVTGYFGSLTRENVRRFQCEHLSLCSGSEDSNGYGRVGPTTRAKILEVCRRGLGGYTQDAETDHAYAQSGYYAQSSYTTGNGIFERDDLTHPSGCSLDGLYILSGSSQVFYAARSYAYPETCSQHSQVRTCLNGVLYGTSQYLYGSCVTTGTINAPYTTDEERAGVHDNTWYYGTTTINGSPERASTTPITVGGQCIYNGVTYQHNELNTNTPGGVWLPQRCCNGAWLGPLGNILGAPECSSPLWQAGADHI